MHFQLTLYLHLTKSDPDLSFHDDENYFISRSSKEGRVQFPTIDSPPEVDLSVIVPAYNEESRRKSNILTMMNIYYNIFGISVRICTFLMIKYFHQQSFTCIYRTSKMLPVTCKLLAKKDSFKINFGWSFEFGFQYNWVHNRFRAWLSHFLWWG